MDKFQKTCVQWKKRQQRLLRPKKWSIKRRQRNALWKWRVSQKPESERRSFIKHSRRMQRYAARGQLKSGVFYCKAGKPITQARIDHYEKMCHFVVRKFLPAMALWEASMAYEDLINHCKTHIFLALLNGFNPKKFMEPKERSQEQFQLEVQKMEQTTVFGRLRSEMRRIVWKNHPDQLGGVTWSLERITERDERKRGTNEFRFGLFSGVNTDSLDFVREQTDRLMEILEVSGPQAVREAFQKLEPEQRDLVGDSLFASSGVFRGVESCV